MSNEPGPGSTGNVLAAICSLIIPGLGQLVQGRVLMALFQFLLGVFFLIFCLHFVFLLVSVCSCIDAALYRGR